MGLSVIQIAVIIATLIGMFIITLALGKIRYKDGYNDGYRQAELDSRYDIQNEGVDD